MEQFKTIQRQDLYWRYRGPYFFAVFGIFDTIRYALSRKESDVEREIETFPEKQYCFKFKGVSKRLRKMMEAKLGQLIRLNNRTRVMTLDERIRTIEGFIQKNL